MEPRIVHLDTVMEGHSFAVLAVFELLEDGAPPSRREALRLLGEELLRLSKKSP